MKRYFLSLALLCAVGYAHAQDVTMSLAKVDLVRAYQQYGAIEADTATIKVHARSLIKVKTHHRARRFQAQISVAPQKQFATAPVEIALVDGTKMLFDTTDGIKRFAGITGSDGKVGQGSVEFIIRGDGKQLYSSGMMRAGDAPRSIDISIEGTQAIDLEVLPTADGASGDFAKWINPQITYREIAPQVIEADYAGEGPRMSDETVAHLNRKIGTLPVVASPLVKTPFDWLIDPSASRSVVERTADGKGVILRNAMVAREFRIFPNLATVDIHNLMSGESTMRAVSSEGSITIDGKSWSIGGLSGQPERGYLKREWLDQMRSIPSSFLVTDFKISPLKADVKWAQSRWALNDKQPTGTRITFTLAGTDELTGAIVKLHFDAYDAIPTIAKSFEFVNNSPNPLNIDSFKLENLAFADLESLGGGDPRKFRMPNLHIESDYACDGGFTEKETDITERWVTDPDYTSQRNYSLQTLCIMEVAPPIGPNQLIAPGKTFLSMRTHITPMDRDDRERNGLFKRRFYRTVTPWATENPIFMHLTSSDSTTICTAVDQCAETGYEMIIISFGSGLNAEDISPRNIQKWKNMVNYARSKGIEMGCYSLLASRWISDSVDVINPKTGKRGGMTFGSSPCLSSKWGEDYFRKIVTFFEQTGMRCFEHDGSYPGDPCASTTHTHHRGLEDSQWNQFQTIRELYRWMCSKGIYINVPDFYFMNGSTKVGIGYREVNWSLPRDRQIIHSRQLNYDCTWERMASALWSFVPLVEYQGGGDAATLEPLSEHLYEYKTHMMQNYGAGVQACYRGPRLYDTSQTKAVVQEVIAWYKKYRRILNSDIIHLRRPDARDWDGIMHVNPAEKERALAMFFNPTDVPITRTIALPLYYTGLDSTVKIREMEGKAQTYKIERDHSVNLTITIPAKGYTWYVISSVA